jgi:mono/diheme cytochrome c family protein
VAAGHKLFLDHCAQCHGENAEGKRKRPSLRSEVVRGARDGELEWFLANGNPAKGMPTWSKLPEQQRWQIVAYLKSLEPQPETHP